MWTARRGIEYRGAMDECRICRAIPDTAERPLPREVEELQGFGGAAYRLRRCPLCGRYYDYFYDHDSGGGTSEGGTDETIRRLSPADAIDALRDVLNELPFAPMPTLEADLERLLREHPEPEEPIDALIQRLDEAVAANDILGNEPANLASWSLGRRGTVRAIPALVRALAVYYLRAHAARALAGMGAVVAPALLAALAAGPVAGAAAACGLGLLARNDPTLAPAIQRALRSRLARHVDDRGASRLASEEAAAIEWAIGMTMPRPARDVVRECRICRAIPDRADADDGLPAECAELRRLPTELCRCPLCGAYYDYLYGYYPGDGMTCDPVTDEVITRLTPAQTVDRIRRALHERPSEPTLAADLERLLRDHPGLAEPGAGG